MLESDLHADVWLGSTHGPVAIVLDHALVAVAKAQQRFDSLVEFSLRQSTR